MVCCDRFVYLCRLFEMSGVCRDVYFEQMYVKEMELCGG